MNNKNIWNQITSSLESTISKSEINTWFSSTTLQKLDEELAVIAVPNKFVASWLRDNYTVQIQNLFKSNVNYMPEIHFIFSGSNSVQETPKYKIPKKSTGSLNHQLDPLLTFSSFVTAKSNRFACSLASEVANKPADRYNPLYLFSKLASGKTHLLNAIGNHVLSNNPLTMIIYVSLDKLSSDFSSAVKNQKRAKFRGDYRKAELLLIDDIHLISGRDKLQKELISIFNYYYQSKKQIVVAGRFPPGQIRKLQPELRSRLEWGLLSELKAPDNNTRMNIIKKKAKKEKIVIPGDVAFFLAKSTNDLKTLSKYLVSIGAYTSLNQREINISVAKSVIKNRQSYKINVKDIQKLTADHFNISLRDLLSNKKTHKFSYPRHVAMYLSRELTDFSYKELAKKFANKDHSTIIYAVKRIENYKKQKKEVLDDINKLQGILS